MKNQNQPESDRLETDKLINSLAEVLKKHCATKYDAECFINSLLECSKFLDEFQAHRHDVVYNISVIKDILKNHAELKNALLFEFMSNIFITGMILSGQVKTGNQLIYEMSEELESII